MSKVSFVPYLKKKQKNDKEGYICLIVVVDGKSSSHSIGKKIHKELWNTKNNTIETMLKVNRSKMSDEQRKEIIEKYNELQKEMEFTYLKSNIKPSENNQSFLQHLNRHIKLLEDRKKIGTSKRYRTTLYHIEKYLDKKHNKTTLLFSEITSQFIEGFETYLLSLGLIENTTKNYINTIKRLYTKSLGEGVFTTTLNPFVNFKNVRQVVRKNFLEKKHVECIMMSEFERNDPLYNIRNYFLFQIFGQGLRVSDLLTLRWGNLKEGVLVFTQYKTKKLNQIYLTPTTIWILKDFVESEEIKKSISRKNVYTFKDKKYNHTYDEIKTLFDEVKNSFKKSPMTVYTLDDLEELKNVMERVLNTICVSILVFLHNYSMTHKNDFIFPLLTNTKLFDKVVFDSNKVISKEQYNHLQTRTTVYNKFLKKLQTEVNKQTQERGIVINNLQHYTPIEISLTSHLPRHTYTNLMIEFGGDLYEISRLIGHGNIQTTDKYINLIKNKVVSKNDDFGKEYTMFLS